MNPPLSSIAPVLWIAVGGAFGAVSRYLVAKALTATLQSSAWPWSTFAVNLAGSLLLVWVLEGGADAERGPEAPLRLALGVGFLGAFTTYSTFNYELLGLVRQGAYGRAIAYAGATLTAAMLGAALALLIARRRWWL